MTTNSLRRAEWLFETAEPDYSDCYRDVEIDRRADELATDPDAISDQFYDGFKVSDELCKAIAEWNNEPTVDGAQAVTQLLFDALWSRFLRVAEQQLEDGE